MPQQDEQYMISCNACGTGNRVPAAREGEQGKCGSCAFPLPPLHTRPVPLTDRNFHDFVEKHPGAVLAEFSAPW